MDHQGANAQVFLVDLYTGIGCMELFQILLVVFYTSMRSIPTL